MSTLSSLTVRLRHSMTTIDGEKTLDVCVEFFGGEFATLAGHSSSGKSTVLRMIAGLSTPKEGYICADGEVWFDSVRGINLSPNRRDIAYMFQDLALFDNMSIEDNLRFAQRGKDDEKIEKLLKIFGLTNLSAKKPDKLTGGLRQRIALARALASEPKLLILDEPLRGLDDETRISLQEDIAKAHHYLGATTIMATRSLHDARKISDSVYKIENGKISKAEKCCCNCSC